MTTFVLIWITIISPKAVSSGSAYFNTESACNMALETLLSYNGNARGYGSSVIITKGKCIKDDGKRIIK